MLLDKKSYDLLSYLIRSEQYQTISVISEHLQQSRRKIYYHLEKINDALPDDVDAIVSVPRLGILLTDRQKEVCNTLLKQADSYFYVMSVEERQDLITLVIASGSSRITIDGLIEICQVSRNTILSDLNILRNRLSDIGLGIKLSVSKAQGYHFEGHPLAFVQYIYGIFLRLDQAASSSFYKIVFEHLQKINQGECLASEELKCFIHRYFPKAEARLGKTLNQKERRFFVMSLPYLLLAYRKLIFPESFAELLSEELAQVHKRIEYDLVKDMDSAVRNQFGLQLDAIEVELITLLLLSFRKDKDSHLESGDYASLRQSIRIYLNFFEEQFDTHFVNREELEKQLLMHCKSLLYRKQYGIPSYNPLTESIKENYERLFTMVASTIYLLEGEWQVSLTDDDISYLVIHIGGAIRQQEMNYQRKKAVIVSDDGIAIQKFLLSRLQRFFSNLKIEAVFTTEQFHSVEDIMSLDLVISTHDSFETSWPVVVVNPLLTAADLFKVLKIVQGQGEFIQDSIDQRIKECVQQFVTDSKQVGQLSKALEQVIYQDLISDLMTQEKLS